MQYNVIFMIMVTVLFVFFSSIIMDLYTTETEVHRYGKLALQIIGTGYVFYGIGMVLVQALNGAGDTKTPTWINVVCFWLIQVPFGWLIAVQLNVGPAGAFAAIPVAEFILAVIAWYWFKKGKWKSVQV